MNQEIKKGYTCPFCQQYNEFSVWVFAHMHIEITHKCDCGKEIILKNGEILMDQMEFSTEDLNAQQAVIYNSFVIYFNNECKKYKNTPVGRIFVDLFEKMIYTDYKSFPPVWFEEDNKKAQKIIINDLVKYVMRIIK